MARTVRGTTNNKIATKNPKSSSGAYAKYITTRTTYTIASIVMRCGILRCEIRGKWFMEEMEIRKGYL